MLLLYMSNGRCTYGTVMIALSSDHAAYRADRMAWRSADPDPPDPDRHTAPVRHWINVHTHGPLAPIGSDSYRT